MGIFNIFNEKNAQKMDARKAVVKLPKKSEFFAGKPLYFYSFLYALRKAFESPANFFVRRREIPKNSFTKV